MKGKKQIKESLVQGTPQQQVEIVGVKATHKNNVQLDIDDPTRKYHRCAEDHSGFCNRLLFGWTGQLVKRGNRRGNIIQEEDLFDIREVQTFQSSLSSFTKYFNKFLREKKVPRPGKSIIFANKRNLIMAMSFVVIGNLLQFTGPIFLKQILQFYEDPEASTGKGYMWASLLFVSYIIRLLLMQHGLHRVNYYAYSSLSSLQGSIFEKVLRMKNSARKYYDSGKVLTLATVDAFAVWGFCMFGSFAVTSPLMIIIAIVLICLEVGLLGLIGPAILLLGMILQAIIQKKSEKVRKDTLYYNDKRSKALNEFINGIRIIKFYGWEHMVQKKVQAVRHHEVNFIFKTAVLRSFAELITSVVPISISIIIFALYETVRNEELTPAKAYSVLAYFNLMQIPLRLLAIVLISLANAKVSLNRIGHFLTGEDYDDYIIKNDPQDQIGDVEIKDGVFAWDTDSARIHYKKMDLLRKAKGNKNGNKKGPQSEKTLNLDEPLKQEDLIVLNNINFRARKGQMVAIVGQVGSGKTSLLNAILGELDKVKGEVKVKGSVAYISQQAFLKNDTLRRNITFTMPYDEEKYQKVLRDCELLDDIKILPGGDLTEIGERGINLSGGQKQRVAIARAVYSESDIYIIDDCLSALDAHVGRNIYRKILQGQLRDKTVIFVTHALHYVAEADEIYIVKGGRIVENGAPAALRADRNSEFNQLDVKDLEDDTNKNSEEDDSDEKGLQAAELIESMEAPPSDLGLYTADEAEHTICEERPKQRQYIDPNTDEIPRKKSSLKPKSRAQSRNKPTPQAVQANDIAISTQKQQTEKGTLVKKEESAKGAVPWRVWKAYMKSGGKFRTFLVFLTFIGFQIFRIANDWWLGVWSQSQFGLESIQYVYIYCIIGVTTGLIVLIRGVLFGFFTKKSAQQIQSSVLWNILRSPISWFDVTPTGRILNRTNKDQDDVDQALPWTLQFAMQNVLVLLSTVVMIGIITPLFLIIAGVFTILYSRWLKRFLRASREIKRLEMASRSPIIQLIGEIANGTTVIRAFNATNDYVAAYAKNFNRFLVASYNSVGIARWIAIRSELFGAITVAGAAYLGVLSKEFNYDSNAGLVGLSITWALQITAVLSFTIKILADSELQMSSYERLLEYANMNKQEAAFEKPESQVANWPFEGKYEMDNIAYRYRPELDRVIHGISFSVKQHEKIGVVGRTGSGKSTLILGLLRILELVEGEGKEQKGSIKLDGVNIADLGLHDVRKRITLIPQDPTLFTGTIRSNIDPFEEFQDDKIIDALKKVQIWDALKEFVEKPEETKNPKSKKGSKAKKITQPNGYLTTDTALISDKIPESKRLDMLVDDGGSNFSLGQRQLLCMARALIRGSKVLLMDEATANIDEKTDHLLQQMIKTEFKDTTVITIAHRLNTIIQYDKILILENGRIADFDTPLNLIRKEGLFSGLIKENGPDFERKMIALATNKDMDVI